MANRCLWLVVLLVAVTAQLSACGSSCDTVVGEPIDAEGFNAEVDSAEVVFVGRAVHEHGSFLSSERRYIFEVDQVFKGEVATEVVVEIRPLCGSDALAFNTDTVIAGVFSGSEIRPRFVDTAESTVTLAQDTFGAGEAPLEVVELSRGGGGFPVADLFGARALLMASIGLGALAVFSLVGKWVAGRPE